VSETTGWPAWPDRPAATGPRCILQLAVLGYILVPIFTYQLWWLVIGYAFFMALVGSWEAISRPAYKFKVPTGSLQMARRASGSV
jgi:ABC-type iron transport system FetAB permease component